MATTTDPADLVTPEEAAAFLNLGSPGDFTNMAVLITRASLTCELYTNRNLKARTMSNVRLSAKQGPKLYLDPFPIDPTQTVTVLVDGAAQRVWRQESDGNPDTFDVILGSDDPSNPRTGTGNHLWRWLSWDRGYLGQQWNPPSGFGWRQHPYALLLSWTGGFATIPPDLKLGCLYVLQRLYRDWTIAHTDVQSQSARAGGGRTFNKGSKGMGADIPDQAKFLLDAYAAPALPFAAA